MKLSGEKKKIKNHFLRKRPRLSQDKKPAFFPLQGLADFTGQMRRHHGVTSDTYLSLFKLKGDLNVKMLLDSQPFSPPPEPLSWSKPSPSLTWVITILSYLASLPLSLLPYSLFSTKQPENAVWNFDWSPPIASHFLQSKNESSPFIWPTIASLTLSLIILIPSSRTLISSLFKHPRYSVPQVLCTVGSLFYFFRMLFSQIHTHCLLFNFFFVVVQVIYSWRNFPWLSYSKLPLLPHPQHFRPPYPPFSLFNSIYLLWHTT